MGLGETGGVITGSSGSRASVTSGLSGVTQVEVDDWHTPDWLSVSLYEWDVRDIARWSHIVNRR